MSRIILLIAFTIALMSFSGKTHVIEFNYPKSNDAKFTLTTDKLKRFKKEWRGEDYYYICENGEGGIVCSVLFYKLNQKEKEMLVDVVRVVVGGPESSPAYPLTYFTTHSNLEKYESNQQQWGEPAGDFMFSQADIKEMDGVKVNQKNMFAYAMFGKDLFVNVHLSKIGYTAEDSVVMRSMLDGLKKIK